MMLVWYLFVFGAVIVSAEFEVIILHNNDMHSRFQETSQVSSPKCSPKDHNAGKCYGGFARLAHLLREERGKADDGGPPVLFLNAGDTYQGSVWFTINKWPIVAKFINILKPDAISLGNHEFDNGVGGLVPFINNVTCPVVACNVDASEEPLLAASKLRPYTVLNVRGVKVGVIGYLTPDTKVISKAEKTIINPEVESIRKSAEELKQQGVNILIAVGHSGYEMDEKIAAEVEDIDLVVGGHTNTFLYTGKVPDLEEAVAPYPKIVQQSSGRRVPVVQAYAYTKYLGKLKIRFDDNGEAISYEGKPILLDHNIPQDPDVLEEEKIWNATVQEVAKQKIGSTRVFLDGQEQHCRFYECNLGNLITDAMVFNNARTYVGWDSPNERSNDSWTDAAIAIFNAGAIRTSIDASDYKGIITMADVLNLFPFENGILYIPMTGNELTKVLEQSVEKYDKTLGIPNNAFLQVSGLHIKYDLEKPVGNRLTKVLVRCSKCRVPKYEILDPEQTYNVLITTFLSEGGDGYSNIKEIYEKYKAKTPILTDYQDVAMFSNYLEWVSPVFPAVEGRIEIKFNNDNGSSSSSSSSKKSHSIIFIVITMYLNTYL